MLVEDLDHEAVRHRRAAPCALRGLRTATVVASSTAAIQLAAAVSLLLAASKVSDHVADGQSPRALRPLARRWERAGRRLAGDVGLDPATLLDPVAKQAQLEAESGRVLLHYTAPTEAATAAAFAHVAVVAARPASRPGLATAGAAFGRLAHVLDTVEDEADDRTAGRFNPLAASATSRADARAVAKRCVGELREGLAAAGVARATLAHRLLVHEAGHAVSRVFDSGGGRDGPLGCQLTPCTICAESRPSGSGQPRRWRDRCGSCCDVCDGCDCCCCCCCCDGTGCCDCCDCGCDCG